MSLRYINEAITNFQELIENSIIENGAKGKEAMIRSSRPILNLHEAVKLELLKYNVNRTLIFPPLNQRAPEIKLAGSRKKKDQDVCVIASCEKAQEILKEGLLENVVDEYGEEFTEKTIAINIRSQISSIQKNFDTLYERTISEAINLHDRCPKMVLGEVYVIAIPEYDDKKFSEKKIEFKKPSQSMVFKYIKSFQAINDRVIIEKNFYKYEKACLLIVDFSQHPPKLYNSTKELIEAGLLPPGCTIDYTSLSWDCFIPDLLKVYRQRFEDSIPSNCKHP